MMKLQFLPVRCYVWHSLCYYIMFVCLSIMFKYCVKMAKDIVKILSSDDSRIILVFFELNCILKFLQALNTGGYKKML